jgi:hypothetical protein
MAGIIIVVAIAAAEVVLSWKWNRTYFAVGLPVFVRRVERTFDDVALDELARSSKTMAASPLEFRRLEPDLVAFREQVLGQYIPVMRGVIRRDGVAGLLNWYVPATAIVLVVMLGRGVVIVAPAFLGAFGILYLIQAVRFNRVARQLRRQTTTSPPQPA